MTKKPEDNLVKFVPKSEEVVAPEIPQPTPIAVPRKVATLLNKKIQRANLLQASVADLTTRFQLSIQDIRELLELFDLPQGNNIIVDQAQLEDPTLSEIAVAIF